MRTGWNDTNAFDDPDTSLADRQRAIAKGNCDYSISIHFNVLGDGKTFNSAKWCWEFTYMTNSLANPKSCKIDLKQARRGTKQTNRGITKEALAMCNCNNLDVKAAIL